MTNNFKKFLVAASTMALFSFEANAQYTLLNPVPDSQRRLMTTERPFKGDIVQTMDAGHVQLETSLYSYTHDDENGVEMTEHAALADTMLRVGLLQDLEFQAITSAYIHRKTEVGGTDTKQDGLGDTTLRLKYNVVGNNGEEFGLSIIPLVKFATNSDDLYRDSTDWGVNIPLMWNVDNNLAFMYTLQNSWVEKNTGNGRAWAMGHSLVAKQGLGNDLYGFVEFFSYDTSENATRRQNTLGVGGGYKLSEDFILDTAFNFGVSEGAADFNWVFGGSYRF